MTSPGSPLDITDMEGIAMVSFRDRILLAPNEIQLIEKELLGLIVEMAEPRLVVDFTEVQALSSRMLGTMINVQNEIKALGGKMALCHTNDRIAKIIGVTKLTEIFEVFANREEAVQHMLSES